MMTWQHPKDIIAEQKGRIGAIDDLLREGVGPIARAGLRESRRDALKIIREQAKVLASS